MSNMVSYRFSITASFLIKSCLTQYLSYSVYPLEGKIWEVVALQLAGDDNVVKKNKKKNLHYMYCSEVLQHHPSPFDSLLEQVLH